MFHEAVAAIERPARVAREDEDLERSSVLAINSESRTSPTPQIVKALGDKARSLRSTGRWFRLAGDLTN